MSETFANRLGTFLAESWLTTSGLLFLLSWFTIPLLVMYVVSRLRALRNPDFDLLFDAPSHHLLQFLWVIHGALVLPGFFLLAAVAGGQILPWQFPPFTSGPWTLVAALPCMVWIATHLFEAALRGGRLRFGPGLVDRLMAALSLALALRFQVTVFLACLFDAKALYDPGYATGVVEGVLMGVVAPQLFALPPTLVAASVLAEALRARPAAGMRRRWVPAVAVTVILALLLATPHILTRPRATHEQALRSLEENRSHVLAAAEITDLDPRLIAGVICIGQRTHRPARGGEVHDALVAGVARPFSGDHAMTESPIGVSSLTPRAVTETYLILVKLRKPIDSPASGGGPGFWWPGLRLEKSPWHSVPYWARGEDVARFMHEEIPRFTSLELDLSDDKSLSPLLQSYLTPSDVLLAPEYAITYAALQLVILRAQWRAAGHPIDDRPDLLATLFDLGYAESLPGTEVSPSEFGLRVAAFMESDDCLALFPPDVESADDR